jgi:hypothetical protein
MKASKRFFFEPFCAARFRLRFVQPSGREKQKTFVKFGPVLVSPARFSGAKVFARFFQKAPLSF